MSPPDDLVTSLARVLNWEGVLPALLVLAAAGILVRFVRGSATRIAQRAGDRRPVVHRASAIVELILALVAFVVASGFAVRWEPGGTALIAVAGTVALGLALRDLVASIVAGAVILFDRPFQVGDRMQFEGEQGDVLAIGLRTVRLRTADDALVTVPNHRFLRGAVRCENHGTVEVAATVELLIGLDQDVARARRIFEEAAMTSRFLAPRGPVDVLVDQVHEASVVAIRLRLRAHVLSARYREAFTSDISERTLQAFREQAILPPAILHRSL